MAQKQDFAFDTLTGRLALMVGFLGMSGSGKTRSAIRWGTGCAAVTGGPLVVIDTESGRAMHHHKRYGGQYEFKHIDFEPPHSTLRYLSAIDYAIEQGAGCIIVDSYSHEHEGVGGALEQHAEELRRLGGSDAMSAMAWMQPKRNRKAVTNRLLQKRIPIAFCFRAKEGVDFHAVDANGKRRPKAQGLVPIGDLQFFYDMTVNFIFRAGSDGVPDWRPDIKREPVTRSLAKCPDQFRKLLGYDTGAPPQVNEELGKAMAAWSSGVDAASVAGASEAFSGWHKAITDTDTLEGLETIGANLKKDTRLTEQDRGELRRYYADRREELTP